MVGINLSSIPLAGNANHHLPLQRNRPGCGGAGAMSRGIHSHVHRRRRQYDCVIVGGLWITICVVVFHWFYARPWLVAHSSSLALDQTDVATNSPERPVACRYHGNCPEGTACDFFRGDGRGGGGVCLPYYESSTTTPPVTATSDHPVHDVCVQTCLNELTIEEGFQYGAIPMVESTSAARPPHVGCVVHFHRQRRQGNWSDRPSMAYRIAQRWRSLVRIDYRGAGPGTARNTGDPQWMALCRQPCLTDQDCPGSHLACLDGRQAYQPTSLQEHRNWTFPRHCLPRTRPPQPQSKHDMVIVSGADSMYFEALENLAASLRYWAPTRKLVIYNLGMMEDQLDTVNSWPNVHAVHWPDGFPSYFPSHVANDLQNYAWKSLIINHTVHEYKSIFWLDSGATFVGPLEPIEEIINLHGLFLVKGQDEDMKYLAHPATYHWHGYDKTTYQAGPHFAGGIQGHVYPSRYIDSIVIPNAKCALDPDCISPTGSSLSNHRFDQTSLSILAYQRRIRAPAYTEFLAGGLNQLSMQGQNLSIASTRFILWTARGTCNFYSRYYGF